jgi:hypothetical protein
MPVVNIYSTCIDIRYSECRRMFQPKRYCWHLSVVSRTVCSAITRERMNGFSWNAVWRMCNGRPDQTHTFNFPQFSTTTWRMLKVVSWENDRASWRRYPWSSAATNDIISHDNICHWSYELFVLPSVSGRCELFDITSIGRLMTSSRMLPCFSGLATQRYWIVTLPCNVRRVRSKSIVLKEMNYRAFSTINYIAFPWIGVNQSVNLSLLQIRR